MGPLQHRPPGRWRHASRALGGDSVGMERAQDHGGVYMATKTTKTDDVLKLLGRQQGATVAQLQKATGWQPHSVRAALTGLRQEGPRHPAGAASTQTSNQTLNRWFGGANRPAETNAQDRCQSAERRVSVPGNSLVYPRRTPEFSQLDATIEWWRLWPKRSGGAGSLLRTRLCVNSLLNRENTGNFCRFDLKSAGAGRLRR